MTNEHPINSDLSDSEIIGRILNGEKELYALLVRRYNQRLYRVGMSILKDDPAVEEAMQVAYVNAYENLSGFGFKASFCTWLTRILINECLLRIKKKKRWRLMTAAFQAHNHDQQLTADLQTPMKKVLNAELKTLLEEAIFALPEKYRTVFIMREMENMNTAETRECLQISEVNVKVRLNRAKALLRNSLSSYYKKEDILHFHLTRCDRMVENVMKNIK